MQQHFFFCNKGTRKICIYFIFFSKKKRKSYNHLPVYWLFMRRPVVFLNVIFSATKSVASGHNLPYIDCTFLICLNNCGLYIESSGSSYKQRDNPQSNLFVSLICWRVIRLCPFKVEQDLNTLNASFASTRWCQPTFFKFFFLFFSVGSSLLTHSPGLREESERVQQVTRFKCHSSRNVRKDLAEVVSSPFVALPFWLGLNRKKEKEKKRHRCRWVIIKPFAKWSLTVRDYIAEKKKRKDSGGGEGNGSSRLEKTKRLESSTELYYSSPFPRRRNWDAHIKLEKEQAEIIIKKYIQGRKNGEPSDTRISRSIRISIHVPGQASSARTCVLS